MRKSILTTCLLACFFTCIAQNYSKVYDYPIKRGQVAWDTIKTYAERRTVSQIPSKYISILSTPVLLESVLNYPMLSDVLIFYSFQNGIDQLRKNFIAFDSLLQRKDIVETVMRLYITMDVKLVDSIKNSFKIGEFMFKISFLEMIIAQNQFSLLVDVQKKNNARVLYQNYLMKSELINKYGNIGLSTTAWALGRLLPPALSFQNELLVTFLAYGMPLKNADLDKLLLAANDYIKP